jgi:diguanylate cyclase (GGDEF)-like protein/PAS domain S-box-containing protein
MADKREPAQPVARGTPQEVAPPDSTGAATLADLARRAERLIGVPRVFLLLGADAARVVAAAEWPQPAAGAAAYPWPPEGQGPEQLLVVDDVRQQPWSPGAPADEAQPVRAYAAVPLVGAEGAILGHLCALDPAPRTWTEADLAVLSDLAALAATVLNTLIMARRQAQVQALHEEVSRALNRPDAPAAALPACAGALAHCLDAALVGIWTRDPASDRWTLAARAGLDLPPEPLAPGASPGGFPIAAVMQARQPYLTNTLASLDPPLAAPAWTAAHGLVAFAGYPLTAGTTLLGALGLFACHPLPPDTLATLGVVASLLAQRIAGAQATAALTASTEALEARVLERTVQMEAVITTLRQEIAGREQVEAALRQSEERFRTLSDLTLEGVAIHDHGRIVEANLSLARLFGYEREALIGLSVLELAAPESRAVMRAHYHRPGEERYEVTGLRKDGTTFPAEIHSRQVPYEGRLLRVGSVRDLTERKQAEEALRRQNEVLAALHETTLGLINQLDPTQLLEAIIARAAALIGTPHGYLYVVEPDQQTLITHLGIGIFAQQVGYRLKWGEGLSGRVWASGEPLAIEDYNQWPGHREDLERLGLHAIVGIPLRSGSEVAGVIGLAFAEPGRRIGPDEIALLTRFGQLASLALENARLYAAAQQELTDRKRAEETMAHLALHDSLTDLPNRALLHERLRQAILAARRTDQPLALLVMDMDRFKEVNDTLGHYYGDVLLCQVGERLRDGLRASDTVARLGGDEFAVLLPGADLAGAQRAARKLLNILEHPFELEGNTLDVRVSIGLALYPDHGADAETLLRRADVAMYVAKRGGIGYALYTSDQDPYNPTRLALIGDLRRAIEQEELVLYYQPKLSYRTGRVTGAEALVRWPHPQHGLLAPAQFIPLAEQMGLIKPLSHCVLNLALRQCRAWYDAGLILPVAVNLSLRDLHDARLPEQIGQLLETWALPPALLHVEITEDAAMADPDRTLGVLTWLRGRGVHLAIDDFGTGQSSLAQLKRLPVDQLKIDQSFVREMTVNENDAVLVRSIIDLGHNLGLTVVAEGVEDAATATLLTSLGCDEGQGFYLSHPVPPDLLVAWLAGLDPIPPPAVSRPARRKIL